jgi:hypothetical protein
VANKTESPAKAASNVKPAKKKEELKVIYRGEKIKPISEMSLQEKIDFEKLG